MEPLLYRPSEVADLIGFGRSKVYDLIRKGIIPSVRVNGNIRVPRQGLLDWIESLSQDSAIEQ